MVDDVVHAARYIDKAPRPKFLIYCFSILPSPRRAPDKKLFFQYWLRTHMHQQHRRVYQGVRITAYDVHSLRSGYLIRVESTRTADV